MKNIALSPDPAAVEVQVLGRSLRLHSQVDPSSLSASVALLEKTFRDMERAYEIRWGSPASALDTSTWVLMGALNLAHHVVRMEQEANRHTQDLEQTLAKLLDDVPDDTHAAETLRLGNDAAEYE